MVIYASYIMYARGREKEPGKQRRTELGVRTTQCKRLK